MVPLSHVVRKLILLALALVALFFAAILAMGWFRRHYLLRDEEEEKEEPPYDIAQLREMYEDGIITGEEFERLKEKIYGRRSYRR